MKFKILQSTIPQPLKLGRSKFGITHGMLNIVMPQVTLNRPLPFLTPDRIASISADNKYSLVLTSEYLRELGDLEVRFSVLPTFDIGTVSNVMTQLPKN